VEWVSVIMVCVCVCVWRGSVSVSVVMVMVCEEGLSCLSRRSVFVCL
jgi:hypothetical protein